MKKSTFFLTNVEITKMINSLDEIMDGMVLGRESLRMRLALEDMLCIWQNRLGEETACTMWYGKRFGRWEIRLSAAGVCADPNAYEEDDDLENAGNMILQALNLLPLFQYENGVNWITLKCPKKKVNPIIWVGIAFLLSTLLGLASLQMPDSVRIIGVDLSAQILTVLLGALTCIAMPMIFLSINVGIVNMGNISVLGKIGTKFLFRFFGVTLVAVFLSIVGTAWMFPIAAGGANTGGFEEILSMIFQIIPNNIVSPFLDKNALQIIFLGFCFGVALLVLEKRVQSLTNCVKQFNDVVNLLMEWINRLIPLFVFLTFFGIIASSDFGKLAEIVRIPVFTTIAIYLFMLLSTILLRLRFRIPMSLFVKKTFSSWFVGTTTASSIASFSIRLEECKKKLGVSEQFANFAVPLAQTLFKPPLGIVYALPALFIAGIYNVQITPSWLILCVVICSIMAIATPPIPGGGKMVYSMIFLQLGIPTEGLMLALAVETVMDFILSGANGYIQEALIVYTAKDFGMLDEAILQSKENV